MLSRGNKVKVLVVEDEAPIQELLKFHLERNKYKVKIADSGEEALSMAGKSRPDIILLDIMLPGTDGLEVCKQLQANPETKHIPVLMLTALCEEADVVAGLELGADDYIAKPFSPRVLLARVKAVLRRHAQKSGGGDDENIRIHNIEVDVGRHKVAIAGEKVSLTFTEFKVLQLLAGQPGRVFTRYQIVDAVRGEDHPVTDRAVDVQIAGLRRKLGDAGSYVETVRGIGYRFREEG